MNIWKKISQHPSTYRPLSEFWAAFIVFLLCSFTISGSAAFSQENDVQLSLNVAKNTFQVGEPVIISVTLANPGEESVHFNKMSFKIGTIRYLIRSGQGSFRRFQSDFVSEPSGSLIELPSGERRFHEDLIHFDIATQALAFPVPGNYSIRAEYVGYLSRLPMPLPAEVSFNVIANTEEDRTWESVFRKKEVADFISGFSGDSATITQIENLIRTYPNSIFSLYGRYYLAIYWARSHQDKLPDFEKAILLMAKTDQPGFQLQAMALAHLGKWNWRAGKTADALSYLDRAINDFPDTYAAYLASDLKITVQTQTPPTPFAPPEVETPIQGQLLVQILALINQYLDFYEHKDKQGISNLLSNDFIYNEVLDKTAYMAELDEDFAKLDALTGNLEIERDIKKTVTVDGGPRIEVELLFNLEGNPLSPPKLVRIELIDAQGTWQIESWKEL